jgi:cation:H+ antiporter
MLNNVFILVVSILLIIQGALYSTKYAVKFAENFKVSKFVVGLIIVAVISILPESLVAINAVLEGEPWLGLGTLFGPNIADLTLVFAIIVLFSWRKEIKIEPKILKINKYFPFFLMLPIILWLDGHYWREEGIALILFGVWFYVLSFEKWTNDVPEIRPKGNRITNFLLLLVSIAVLLVWAHFAVTSWIDIAKAIGVDPILIGILVIWLWTVTPELLFWLQAVKNHHDSLAVGDILWTVLADATIVVGIIAIMGPFYFPQKVIYITGVFMLIAAFLISYCMRTGKSLTRREGVFLLFFWLTYVLVEYFVNR